MPAGLIYDDRFLLHDTRRGHPERPDPATLMTPDGAPRASGYICAMSRGRSRAKWTELIDGPLAGERTTMTPLVGKLTVTSAAPDRLGMIIAYVYEPIEHGKARYIRQGEPRPLPPMQPHYVQLEDPMFFAGLWEYWEKQGEPIETYTILATGPNELMAKIHDRMSVILDRRTSRPGSQRRRRPTHSKVCSSRAPQS